MQIKRIFFRKETAQHWSNTGILLWSSAVHHLCCRPVSDHRKAPPRRPRLCRWPPSLPVIQTHSLHKSNWLIHCHCGRTGGLDDFQHANREWQQNGIIDFWKQLERVNIPFIHVGEDQITPVITVQNLGVIFYSNLKMDIQITNACQNAYPQHQESSADTLQFKHVWCTLGRPLKIIRMNCALHFGKKGKILHGLSDNISC